LKGRKGKKKKEKKRKEKKRKEKRKEKKNKGFPCLFWKERETNERVNGDGREAEKEKN